jgi:hypothetical protein
LSELDAEAAAAAGAADELDPLESELDPLEAGAAVLSLLGEVDDSEVELLALGELFSLGDFSPEVSGDFGWL